MPRTTAQCMIVSLGLLTGAFVNANIFGELALILSDMNRKLKKFELKMARSNTVMIDLKLPFYLQQDIRHGITTDDPMNQRQNDLLRFLHVISPSLEKKILIDQFSPMVSKIISFQNRPKEVNSFLTKMILNFIEPDVILMR